MTNATKKLGANKGKWKDWYDELVRYKKATGHTNVPQCSIKNLEFGLWIMTQWILQYKLLRTLQEDKPNSMMTTEQISLLKEIGSTCGRREMARLLY